MTKNFCDRCKKEAKVNHVYWYDGNEWVEICKTCLVELKKWLKTSTVS